MSNILLPNGQTMMPNGYNLGYSLSSVSVHPQYLQPMHTPLYRDTYHTDLQERYRDTNFWREGWKPRQDDLTITFPFQRGY